MPVGLVFCSKWPASLARDWASARDKERTNCIDHRPHAVQILDLASLAKLAGVVPRDRDIDIDPHAAFLHVGIASTDRLEQALHFSDIRCRLSRGCEVGLGDDFYERSACAIQVNEGRGRMSVVRGLCSVLQYALELSEATRLSELDHRTCSSWTCEMRTV